MYKLIIILTLFSQFSFGQISSLNDNYKLYDIKYERLFFEADPNVRYIKGNVTFYFVSKSDSLKSILLALSDSLSVDSVKYQNNLLSFTHSNNLINSELPVSVALNHLDSITIFYNGIPPVNTEFVTFSVTTHGGQYPIMSTMSEPYAASYWMPVKQSLHDKIDSIYIIIKTPEQYTAVSNGLLTNQITNSGYTTFYWKHKHPICYYLIAFSITNYQLFSQELLMSNNDTINVDNYLYPETYSTESSKAQWMQNIFNYFYSYFTPYPYKNEKYGHALWENNGGMEHQTISFMKSLDYGLMVHELAHQWFGNYITCGSWKDIWVNEGFATYLSILIEQHYNSIWYTPLVLEKIDHVCSQPDGSVYCYDTTSVQRVFSPRLSYSKGAMVLHTLRWEIGDSSFYKSINSFLTDSLLTNKIAYTADVLRHFEQNSDTSLTEFFNDWIYGEGYPIYTITWSKGLNNKIFIKVNQQQSHSSVSFFEAKIPMKLKSQSNDTTVIVKNTFQNQVCEFDISFSPDSLIFDPYNVIITKNPSVIQSVEEFANELKFEIFPTVTTNFIIVNTNIKLENISIIDINGNSVISNYRPKNNHINVLDLKTGSYYLFTEIEGIKIVRKFLKI